MFEELRELQSSAVPGFCPMTPAEIAELLAERDDLRRQVEAGEAVAAERDDLRLQLDKLLATVDRAIRAKSLMRAIKILCAARSYFFVLTPLERADAAAAEAVAKAEK